MKRFLYLVGLLLACVAGTSASTAHAQNQPANTATKTCSFYCVPVDGNDQPRGEPIQAQVVDQCDANSECEAACRERCGNNGTTDPDAQGRPTNGLPLTSGRLRCHMPEAPTASNRPRCVDPRAPAGGAQPQGQGTTSANGTGTASSGNRSGSQGAVELLNPLGRGVTSIPQLFGRVVRAFMGILGALAMFWFVWGGILWMTAEESKRSEQAQTIMKNAALGLILIFFSYGLTTMFLSLFQEVATNASAPAQRPTPPPARR